MGRLEMKGVCQKAGRLYYRRKVGGKDQYVRLPNLDDPRFAESYARASRATHAPARPGRGTLAALVAEYRASSAFRAIPSPVTRANYARYLDMIVTHDGHRSVAGCRTSDVRKLRDRMQDKPGKANNWLNVFRTIMGYAAENDWRRDNPAAGIKPLPIGEREPWPADVLTRAIAAASPMMRLAIVTGLCSGARIGDVIRMQHGWHDGAMMEMRATKNKTDVAIPMHPLWLAELAAVPRKSVTILYDRSGKPFASTKTLQERVRTLMKSIDAPEFTFHGLRKNAACYLVETGLSDAEVGAIVAMTPETVRHYSKRARTLMMSRGVADRVTRGDVVPLKVGRGAGIAK